MYILLLSFTFPLYFLSSNSGFTIVTLALLIAALGISEIVGASWASPLSILQPKNAVIAMYILLFSARPIVVVMQELPRNPHFGTAMLVALWGLVVFLIGHGTARPVKDHIPDLPYRIVWRSGWLWLVTTALVIVNLWALVMVIRSEGGVEAFIVNLANYKQVYAQRGYLMMAVGLGKYAAILWLLRDLTSPKRRIRLVTVALGGLAIVGAAASGSRTYIIALLAAAVVMLGLVKRRRRVTYFVVAAGVMAMIVTGYRSLVRERRAQDIETAGDVVTESVGRFKQIDKVFDFGNFGMVDIFANMIESRDEGRLPAEYGMTYVAVLTQPIPRKWYPQKLDTAGPIVTKTLYPRIWDTGTGLHFSAPGELYLNWGIIGVILGLFLFGYFCCVILNQTIRTSTDVRTIGYFSISLIRFASLTKGEFVSVMTPWLLDLFFLWLAFALVCRKRPLRQARPTADQPAEGPHAP